MKRPLLPALALLVVPAVLAALPARADSSSLEATLWRLLGPAALPGSQVSAFFATVPDGKAVFALHPDLRLPPASTAKLFLTAAALARLGAGFRYVTRLYAQVPPRAGAVEGNLYLVGGGDPSLRLQDLASLAACAARHVRAVSGQVTAVTGAFAGPRTGPDWEAEDAPYGWAAPASALTVHRGATSLRIAPGEAVGAPAAVTLSPPAPLTVRVQARTGPAGSPETLWLARDGPVTVVRGTIPLGAAPVKMEAAVPHPSLWAAQELARDLQARGVPVSLVPAGGSLPDGAVLLCTHRSRPLAHLLETQNRWSVNLYAENLLRTLGAKVFGPPGTQAAGAAAVRQWLTQARIPFRGTLVDGSGLSLQDAVSARDLVELLLAVRREPWFPLFLRSLPVGGAPRSLAGTLGSIGLFRGFRPYAVVAKTGNVAAAEDLAGYIRDRQGRVVAFAVLVNGQPRWNAGWYAAEAAAEAVANQ